MSNHNDDIKLKLAWQAAHELRSCPDSDTLHALKADENLNKHLAICHVCREKLEMQPDERNAWKILRDSFATIAMKPGSGTDKHAGQVWTIKKEFGGWREDGRFVRPPSVLLLDKIAGTSGWRVAQLYGDKRMMGTGDIALDEQFGFAEAWNCYSLKNDRFDKFLGGVKPEELKQVITASVVTYEPGSEGSILSFFRSMEIDVGAFVAVPAVVELVEEWEESLVKESITEQQIIPGVTLELIRSSGKKFLSIVYEGLDNILQNMSSPSFAFERSRSQTKYGTKDHNVSDTFLTIGIPFVPTGICSVKGNTHIYLALITDIKIIPNIIVSYKNSAIDPERISCNIFDTTAPEIKIAGLSFTLKDEKEANPLIRTHSCENTVYIEIMPNQ